MKFTEFDLQDEIFAGLKDVRYEVTTPIQEKCIPLVLEGRDVIGSAQTGTGKTGAFVIPLIEKILRNKRDHTQALILAPTRELARQIDEQIFAIGYHTGISSATVIGGSDFAEQARSIRAGVDIIVATPGRLLDQMNVLEIDFEQLDYLVLDECDRMLDMGFLPDVTKIVSQVSEDRQTLLFSATMPKEIQKVVDQIMTNPESVQIEASTPADTVDQLVYFVPQNKKIALVQHIFDAMEWETALIFTATKRGTDELERSLKKRDLKVVSMHGDRSQEERNEALRHFRNKTLPIMVATDVLARGIDIDDISIIINYDVPNTPDDYIHRIGRTGRYDKTGKAITLVSNKDKRDYYEIRKVVGDQISLQELPDHLQSGDKKKAAKKRDEHTNKEKGKKPTSKGDRNESEVKTGSEKESGDEKQKQPKKKTGRPPTKDSGERTKKQQEEGQKDREEVKEKDEDRDNEQSRNEDSGRKKRRPRPQSSAKGKRNSKDKSKGKDSGNGNGKEQQSQASRKATPAKEEKKKDTGRSEESSKEDGHGRRPKKGAQRSRDDELQPEVVEKAVSRNRYSRKPAKGYWGVIKSLIPKFWR